MKKIFSRLLLALSLMPVTALAGPADFAPPEPVTIEGYSGHAMEPFISRDGKWLFFNNRNQPKDQTDIHIARRIGNDLFEYAGPLEVANSEDLDGVPSMDRAGNFYFISPRDYSDTHNTLTQADFSAGTVTNLRPIEGNISRRKALWLNIDAEISADGQTLYLAENRWRLLGGGIKSSNLLIGHKDGTGAFIRDEATDALFANINSEKLEFAPATTNDELTLYFTRVDTDALDQGVAAGFGIYVATRPSKTAPFGPPEKIIAISGYVEGPSVTPDDCGIYFHKLVNERFEIWHARKSDCAK